MKEEEEMTMKLEKPSITREKRKEGNFLYGLHFESVTLQTTTKPYIG